MWTFPFLAILLGCFAVMLYFLRSKVTIYNDGRPGSPLGAFFWFIVIALIGWAIDAYVGFSTIFTYMWVVGGTLQILAALNIIGFVALFVSMLYVAYRWGQVWA